MTKWSVEIRVDFTRMIRCPTPQNPTNKQVDAYMRKGSKYKKCIEEMFSKKPSKIKYSDGGKLTFELDNIVYPTAKSVKDSIKDIEISYPTKHYGNSPELLGYIKLIEKSTKVRKV